MYTIKTILANIKKDSIQKVVVGAIIIDGKRVLTLRRVPNDFMGGLVEIPSGTVDAGESIYAALRREVKEETGLSIESIDSYIDSFDYVSSSGKKTRQLNFLVSVTIQQVLLSSEHDLYQWLSSQELQSVGLPMSDETKSIIKEALEN